MKTAINKAMNKKRILSLAFTLTLVLGLFPCVTMPAYADTSEITITSAKIAASLGGASKTASSYTQDNITITASIATTSSSAVGISGDGSFAYSKGNIKKIVITCDGKAAAYVSGSGWSYSGKTATWSGTAASSVAIEKAALTSVSTIVCTVETKAAGSISYATTSVSKTYGDAAFTNTLTKTGDGAVTYKSSNTSVATVDSSSGKVTIKGAGSATITATVTDSDTYTYATKTATYTLTVSQKAGTISYTTTSVSKTFGDAAFTNELTNTGDGEVTYSSSDKSVATVDSENGEVTINGAGSTTITATVTDGTNYTYETKTAAYTITVTLPMTVSAEGYTGAYDGNAHGITVSVTVPESGYTIAYGTSEGTYNLTESPTITNVKDSPLTVYYKVTAEGYTDKTGSATVTLSKAVPTVTAPTANTLTYTGEKQALIEEGSASFGEMQYSLDGTSYSTTIPTGTDAGT